MAVPVRGAPLVLRLQVALQAALPRPLAPPTGAILVVVPEEAVATAPGRAGATAPRQAPRPLPPPSAGTGRSGAQHTEFRLSGALTLKTASEGSNPKRATRRHCRLSGSRLSSSWGALSFRSFFFRNRGCSCGQFQDALGVL